MFNVSTFEFLPSADSTIGTVFGSTGNHYVYDAINVHGSSSAYVMSYRMPIPKGPLVDITPTNVDLTRGVILDEPYTGPSYDLFIDSQGQRTSAPEVTTYVPVLGHTAAASKAESLSATNYFAADPSDISTAYYMKYRKFVPGVKKVPYTYTYTRTFTKSGVAVWYYRGKRYTRPWTKTWTKTYSKVRYMYLYDSYGFVPRTKSRRLHNCTHSQLEGSLCVASDSLGFDITHPHYIHPQSSWPTVVESGKLLDCVGRKEYIDVPVEWSGSKATKTWRLMPRLYRSFITKCVRSNSSEPLLYEWYPVMFGMYYIGTMSAPNTSASLAQQVHVWAYLSQNGSDYHSVIRYYAWAKGRYSSHPDVLLGSKTFNLPDIHRSHDEVYTGNFILRHFKSKTATELGFNYVNMWRNINWVEGVYPSLHVDSSNIRDAYDRLWSAVLPDNFSHLCDNAIGYASQEALLNTKVLNINTLMYLKDFTEMSKLVNSFTDLISKGISPKTVSSAYLAEHYGVRLTIADTKELIHRIKRALGQLQDSYQYSRGSGNKTIKGPYADVDIHSTVSVLFTALPEKMNWLFSQIARWDLIPTPRVIWDMIPYSFVVDWIGHVGDDLASIDAWLASHTVLQKRCCWSVKTSVELDPVTLGAAIASQDMSLVSCSGCVTLTGYKRQYQEFAPHPSSGLDLNELDPSWSRSRLYEITALTVSSLHE